jgi:hypothetical protein
MNKDIKTITIIHLHRITFSRTWTRLEGAASRTGTQQPSYALLTHMSRNLTCKPAGQCYVITTTSHATKKQLLLLSVIHLMHTGLESVTSQSRMRSASHSSASVLQHPLYLTKSNFFASSISSYQQWRILIRRSGIAEGSECLLFPLPSPTRS